MLAKKGSSMEQPENPVPQSTCKQIIKSNIQSQWMSDWAQEKTGRALFPYMPKPNKKDNLNQLNRKQQSIIFRLRTQHVPLNAHLNRFNPMHEPLCPLCDHANETVEHFLLDCQKLQNLRENFQSLTLKIHCVAVWTSLVWQANFSSWQKSGWIANNNNCIDAYSYWRQRFKD